MKTITSTIRIATLALVASGALAGCASQADQNSFGARLAVEGGEVAKIGEDWNRAQEQISEGRNLIEGGESQIKKGEKQIASGEDNVDEGQAKIRRGERLISDGELKSVRAEAEYDKRITKAASRVNSTNKGNVAPGAF